MRRRLVLAAAVIVACILVGRALAPSVATRDTGDLQLTTEQRLMCPQCTETRLDVCDRPICRDMKSDIAQRLSAGQRPDAIVADYRRVYGPGVVASGGPGAGGWVPPALVLMSGGLVLFALLGRRPPSGISAPPVAGGARQE